MAKSKSLTLTAEKLRSIIAEELKRVPVSEHRGDPGKPSDPPQTGSSSKHRRDHHKYQNDRMTKDKTFAGYGDMKSLSYGVVEEVFNEMMAVIEEGGDSHCFTSEELRKYKDKIWKRFLKGVNLYQQAEKGKLEAL